MFELHIDDKAVDSGSVPVRWCLHKDTLKLARSKPFCILIVVRPLVEDHWYEVRSRGEQRYVCAVEDLMTFVSFRYPGKNRIYAFLCSGEKRTLEKNYLSRSNSRSAYENRVINSADEEETNPQFLREFRVIDEDGAGWTRANTYLDVNVPQEAFGEEPAAWEKWWVNLPYPAKAIDQCQFKRRRIGAYSIQPLVMLLFLSIRYLYIALMTLVAFAFGMSIELWPLWRHPVSGDLTSQKFGNFGSRYVQEHTDESILRIALRIASMPLWFGIGIGLWLYTKSASASSWWIYGLTAPLVVFVGILLFMGFVTLLASNLSKPKPVLEQTTLTDEEVAYITCTLARGTAGLATLPKKRRSVRLRLQDYKSKVCRPYAG